MSVEPNVFVAAMARHWQSELRNVTSPNLEAVWHQMASTFNHQIATFVQPMSDEEKLSTAWNQIAPTVNRETATKETIAAVFDHYATSADTLEGQRWKVLQPATGTGKSQGLAVYCSMLPPIDHPGVLIVTRLKSQADEIATTINTLTGSTNPSINATAVFADMYYRQFLE